MFNVNLRGQNHDIMLAHVCCMDSKLSRNSLVHEKGHCDKGSNISKGCILLKPYSSGCSYSVMSFLWCRKLSSDVGARQGQKDDDLEDGFSDKELPPEADAMVELEENEDDEELVSEGEISEEYTKITANDSLGLLDSVSDFPIKKRRRGKRAKSPLFKIIMEAPSDSFNSTLDKWVEDGNHLGRDEISFTMLNLRRYRLYMKALQVRDFCQYELRMLFVVFLFLMLNSIDYDFTWLDKFLSLFDFCKSGIYSMTFCEQITLHIICEFALTLG